MQSRCWLVGLCVAAVGCGLPRSGVPDAGPPQVQPVCLDNDGDGVGGTGVCLELERVDCDDADPRVRPGAAEVCDGVDNDCDGRIDEELVVLTYFRDEDGDGVGGNEVARGCGPPPLGTVASGGDCDDRSAKVFPGADESCNGVDDDCNGKVDDEVTFRDFFPDADQDGYGAAGAVAERSCVSTVAGKAPNALDCDDRNGAVHPGAAESCNGVDDDCNARIDDGLAFINYYVDADGDGFGQASSAPQNSCVPIAGRAQNDQDCDDQDPTVKPGAPEGCNGRDDNCNGRVDEGLTFASYWPDQDGDGFGASSGSPVSSCRLVPGRATNDQDCNDLSAAVKPGAPEVCNGVDDDCHGGVDDGLTFTAYYLDSDGDGFGAGSPLNACLPVPGRVANNQDCNDRDATVKPGAPEVCNGADDDCTGGPDDGLTFRDYWTDADGDSFGAPGAPVSACAPVPGKATNGQDCDDTRASVHPGAVELCNGVDDNCQGGADEGLTFRDYWLDADGDSYGASSSSAQSACAPISGRVTNNQDCDDSSASIHPGAPETCNSLDDNCDGFVDNGTVVQSYYPDLDADGYGAVGSTAQSSCAPVPGKVTNDLDCNDQNAGVRPGVTEQCNGADDDCNGAADDGLTFVSYFPDLDADGYGAAAGTAQPWCAPVPGKVSNNLDCNDQDAAIRPTQPEVCDGMDQDCDQVVDEGLPTQSYWPDSDQDGFGRSGAPSVVACAAPPVHATNDQDCNDQSASIRPGASEACNNVDDNCQGGVDEGNPGGGSACNTGQSGVCAAGTVTCQAGVLGCLRDQNPSAELCNGLDDDCDSSVDEAFPDKNTGCTAGLGGCARSGTWVCKADGSGTECSATPGAPTAAACDGQDNDCDGIADEPATQGPVSLYATAYADLEVAPYYYSAGSCAGGVNGSGTDALAGGGLVMAAGQGGLRFQRLDGAGAPIGTPVQGAGYLTYTEVALAQAGDGFLAAGVYRNGSGTPIELDFYYFDMATGVKRAQLWSQFNTGNALDSLRVVRGNGRRVTVIWREGGVGMKLARIEPTYDAVAGTWSLRAPGGGAVSSSTMVASTGMQAGIGVDSTHADWDTSQTCAVVSAYRRLRVAYLPSSQLLKYFDVDEDGWGKSAETTVDTATGAASLGEPEVAHFRSASTDHWVVAHTRAEAASEELRYWLSTSPAVVDTAYLAPATVNGADSIRRPRVSVSPTRLWLTALRYVSDPTAYTRQIMTRKLDFSGNKDPAATDVELSATTGATGDKDGLAPWASPGKLFFSGSGTSVGVFVADLVCQ